MDLRDIYIVKKVRNCIKKINWEKENKLLENEANKRRGGFLDERYVQLKMFHNKYAGKRCFIVATGPSLTLKDLDLIKNEYSFSMNSIIKLFDQTEWRPTFYGIQDAGVFEHMKDLIAASGLIYIFMPDSLKQKAGGVGDNYISFPYNSRYHTYDTIVNRYYHVNFSDDAYGVVYDGYSITYSIIQIAIYFGFKEIYLLGADCNYLKGQRNHIVESGHIDRNDYLNHDKQIVAYRAAADYIKDKDIKIINCTRGGMLEVFPRMTLEEVLKS